MAVGHDDAGGAEDGGRAQHGADAAFDMVERLVVPRMPDSADAIGRVLVQGGGWTLLTAVNLMLFSLLHNPCSTTIYTIYKETKSVKWTVVASVLPVILGFIVTFLVAQIWRILA